MKNLFKKIKEFIENPQHPCLGPILRGLQVTGLWCEGSQTLKMKIWSYFCLMFCCVFFLTQYYYCYLLGSDVFNYLQDVSLTIQYTTGTLKAASLIVGRANFRIIIEAISRRELEDLTSKNHKISIILKRYLKYSHTLTYLYCIMGSGTVVMLSVSPLIKYVASSSYRDDLVSGNTTYALVLGSWFPFDTDTNPGYAVSVIIHLAVTLCIGFILIPYDSLVCAIMVFFKGQLEILKVKCSIVFGDEDEVLSRVEIRRRLVECHTIHNNLIKHARMFNNILSPVMCVYLLTCSIMICGGITQLMQEDIESYDRLHIIDYMISLHVQLFIHCWFTHQVYYTSNSIAYSLFESKWWEREFAHVRRDVLLLAGKLNTNTGFIFTAGPIFALNVSVFINVLRGAYSFYTLIAGAEKGQQTN